MQSGTLIVWLISSGHAWASHILNGLLTCTFVVFFDDRNIVLN